MNKTFLHILTAGALLIGANNLAQASHHEHEDMDGHMMGGPMMDHDAMLDESGGPMKKLNLTDEQKKKIKEIRSTSGEAMKAKREAMKAAGEALRDAMKPETPKDEVMTKFTAAQEKRADFARSHMETMLAVRDVLTVEQRKQWHEGHMGKGMKKGGRGRRGG
jgi:Spy/CpxP family protein refolding chaperone